MSKWIVGSAALLREASQKAQHQDLSQQYISAQIYIAAYLEQKEM